MNAVTKISADLPPGWAELNLRLARRQNSETFNPARALEEVFELYSVPSHETGTPEFAKGNAIGSTKQHVAPGDVLISKINPRLNRVWVVGSFSSHRKIASTEWVVFPANKHLNEKYLFFALTDARIRDFLSRHASGVGGSLMRARPALFDTLSIPLPPLNEQRRIVAKIEELFSELDKGVESLTTAREQLKAYRQSLLKHAFEGKLTGKVRKDGGKDASRAACQKPKGKRGPEIPDDLAEYCADCWTWHPLGDVSDITGGLTKNPKRSALPLTMKYLRVANVYADHLELTEVSEIGVTGDEFHGVKLQRGDLLVVEGNGSVGQIGRVAMWGGELENVGHQNHLIRVRLIPGMSPRFFLSFLMSPLGRDLIVRKANSTSGLHTLSISKISSLPVPVPSTKEQEALVDALAAPLSEIAKQAEEIEIGLAKCSALRQAILKQALSGQLVPQDVADEPASLLLERIRASWGEGSTKKRRKSKNGQKEAA